MKRPFERLALAVSIAVMVAWRPILVVVIITFLIGGFVL